MPFVPLPYFDDPTEFPVWRYVDIEKLLYILTDKALFFPSLETLARFDRYEGQPTGAEIFNLGIDRFQAKEIDNKYNRPVREVFYFNCWHMNDGESDAMWKIYVNGTGGVAIRSSISRLRQCFQNSERNIHLGEISYIGNETIGEFEKPMHRCMRKSLAFKHEPEVRLAYYDESRTSKESPGVSIPVDVKLLIEKIAISPKSKPWFASLVKNLVEKLGYDMDVVDSAGAAPLPF
jgi:hypothetical protein